MPPVHVFVGHNSSFDYYAGRSGRLASSQGAVVRFGASRYLWERAYDGTNYWGTDPGGRAANSWGTGHRLDLASGDRTATQHATAVESFINSSVPGYTATRDGASLEITGPDACTIGTGWDSATRGGLEGSTHARVDGTGYAEGPTNGVFCQRLQVSAARELVGLKVLFGGTVSTAMRFWLRNGSSTEPDGTLIYDFGTGVASSDGWLELPVTNTTIELAASTNVWLIWADDQNSTQLAFYPQADSEHDWTGDMLEITAGESSDPDTAPSSAAPSGLTTATESTTFYLTAALVFGGTEGDGSHFSATNTGILGIHDPLPVTSIDADDVLLSAWITPPYEGMRHVNTEYCAGTTHTTDAQWRVGAAQGGTTSPASSRDINGATLLADNGNVTGTATSQWVPGGTTTDVAINSSSALWIMGTHPTGAGNDAPVLYTSAGDLGPIDAPHDWQYDGSANAEVEAVLTSGQDSTAAYPSTMSGTLLIPRLANFPGVRGRYYIPGMVIQ